MMKVMQTSGVIGGLLAGIFSPAGYTKAATIASYDFDIGSINGTQVDTDDSAQTNWTTSILLDNATGNGALNRSNQANLNRSLQPGNTGNYLGLSSRRERATDSSGPNDIVGNSTWFTFNVTPSAGFSLDFTGQNASIDTYAFNGLGGFSSTDWSLYFSLDGGNSYTSLGTIAGQSAGTRAGTTGPQNIAWSLDPIGVQTGTIDFLLDPVSTERTNGVVRQRSTGFDNLVVNASVETTSTEIPEPVNVLGLVTAAGLGCLFRKKCSQYN